MENNEYLGFLQEARQFIPQERIYTDELRRLAWGTDAGFYRLIPQIVIRSTEEDEVSQLLKLADRYRLPVTFRVFELGRPEPAYPVRLLVILSLL